MPWGAVPVEELRYSLASRMMAKEASMSELVLAFGVSRKTAYKWRARFIAGGKGALSDQSRARPSLPNWMLGVAGENGTLGPSMLTHWIYLLLQSCFGCREQPLRCQGEPTQHATRSLTPGRDPISR